MDAGFFATQGDGSGVVQDLGRPADRVFPEYAGRYGWALALIDAGQFADSRYRTNPVDPNMGNLRNGPQTKAEHERECCARHNEREGVAPAEEGADHAG